MVKAHNPDLSLLDTENRRIESSAAAFQKALYHLFVLSDPTAADRYAWVMRAYQSAFFLRVSQRLLDLDTPLPSKPLRGDLGALCADRLKPTPAEIDPAVLLDHAEVADKWRGYRDSHPSRTATDVSHNLVTRLQSARHQLAYRPMQLKDKYADGKLLADLSSVPSLADVKDAHQKYFISIRDASVVSLASPSPGWAPYFVERLFLPYEDKAGQRPTETLYLTYARMLANPGDEQSRVDRANKFRRQFLELDTCKSLDPFFRLRDPDCDAFSNT